MGDLERQIIGRNRSLTIFDDQAQVDDFINLDEALGFFMRTTSPERVNAMAKAQAGRLNGMPPIKGWIRINDGGEMTIGDFSSIYEIIGFITVKLQETNQTAIIKQIVNTPPDKWKEVIIRAIKGDDPKDKDLTAPLKEVTSLDRP